MFHFLLAVLFFVFVPVSMGPVGIISVRLVDFFSPCLICDGHATLLPIRIWTQRRRRRRHMPNECVQKCAMGITGTILE